MNNILEEYLALVQKYPALFENPSDDCITVLLDRAEIVRVEEEVGQRLVKQGLPAAWARIGIVYQDQYITTLRDAVRFPDGTLGTYTRNVVVDSTPGVIVLPMYQGQILLIRHFRHATRSWHLEIPRGYGIPGASGEENARRELDEEIGGKCARLISLGQMHPDSGITSDNLELFYAELQSYGKPEVSEAINAILPISAAEFEELIRANKITDSFTIVAYARAKLHGVI
jgi:ADP-ribose pyrophosphatase